MPEYRGRKADNAKVAAAVSSRWKSLGLLRTSVDDDGLAEIVQRAPSLREISIDSERITDRGIEQLCKLPQLVSLLLHHAPLVTDASMPAVGQLSQLRELYLQDTQLSDAGIEALLGLENVWSLQLSGTNITDAGVARLGQMKRVSILNLSMTGIRGHGLSGLHDIERMNLYLEGCLVTDEGLRTYLASHRGIETLSLNATQITDESMPALAALPMLIDLRLNHTAVTDAGIRHWIGHPRLSSIYLEGTEVSREMVQQLRDHEPHHVLIVYPKT